MPFIKLKDNVFDCSVCDYRCDATSRLVYNFEDDIEFSNLIQNIVIGLINRTSSKVEAKKFEKDNSYPDILIQSKNSSDIIAFIEIKVQTRTFMKIREILPEANLFPSETLALNLSDLERYFNLKEKLQKPIYLVWCLINRPCITGLNFESFKFYFQEINVLRHIRDEDELNSRRFRRQIGQGDIDENGQHRGVLVNYHYSINEMNQGLPQFH
ncbi:MAG: hypothetical protein N3F03_01760 [Ignavibacteria bacterium]|nr:hypothetical protein [Ignavibacteria bacterium]